MAHETILHLCSATIIHNILCTSLCIMSNLIKQSIPLYYKYYHREVEGNKCTPLWKFYFYLTFFSSHYLFISDYAVKQRLRMKVFFLALITFIKFHEVSWGVLWFFFPFTGVLHFPSVPLT